MSPITSLLTRRAISLVAAAAVFAAVSDRAEAAPAAAPKQCAEQRHAISADGISTVWMKSGKLMSCTTYGGRDAQTRELGRWASQGHLSVYGSTVAWTQRVKRGGHTVDAVYAADLASTAKRPLFLKGILPTTGVRKGAGARVTGLVADGRGAAWTTGTGSIVAALPGTGRVNLGNFGERAADALEVLRIEQETPESASCTSESNFRISTSGYDSELVGVTVAASFATGIVGC